MYFGYINNILVSLKRWKCLFFTVTLHYRFPTFLTSHI
jgi:hypothetical protein